MSEFVVLDLVEFVVSDCAGCEVEFDSFDLLGRRFLMVILDGGGLDHRVSLVLMVRGLMA